MALQTARPAMPSEDKRWKLVSGTMRRNGYAGHALIETLHSVQSAFGYLDAAPGGTTPDDRLSLLTARCVGACGLAPAVVLDGNVLGKQAADELLSRIEELT